MADEKKFMKRAMELAVNGLGKVSPNPMVGCVVVYRNEIIGEGWHEYFGGPHAEVNALEKVDKKKLKRSKVFVTLEPCSHMGKTPPCTNLLIKSGVKEVVIGSKDPNTMVNGSGILQLEAHGIKVRENFMEKEAKEMNRRFSTFHSLKRPYIILKWAQTDDGFIARETGASKWISNDMSRKLTHKWRTEEDAILIGARTAEKDDPQLTARDWEGKNPVRIILGYPELHPEANLRKNDSRTWIFNTRRQGIDENISWIKVGEHTMLKELMRYLFENNIQSLLVEGGSKTLNNFLKTNLWDEARTFTSAEKFGKGIAAPILKQKAQIQLEIDNDVLSIIRNY